MKNFNADTRTAPIVLLCMLLTAGATAARAQSESDVKLMDKARALYSTGPIPGSISCDVVLDWDGFFQRMKVQQDDAAKSRLEKLKAIKISIASQGAEKTDVKVEVGDTASNGITDGLRMQLRGFFQVFWSEGYGRMIPKRGEIFTLTSTPNGYSVKTSAGPMKASFDMDEALLITSMDVESPQLSAVATPTFKPGDDGLLRLRNVDETIDMGASKMVVDMGFDYQRVDSFDIPQHLSLGLPGSFRFDYTLTGCQVTAAVDLATPAE